MDENLVVFLIIVGVGMFLFTLDLYPNVTEIHSQIQFENIKQIEKECKYQIKDTNIFLIENCNKYQLNKKYIFEGK